MPVSGLQYLKNLQQLKTLHLSETSVTDAQVQQLPILSALETIDLTGTEITDAAVAHLSGFPSLATLRLNNTAITGKTFEHVSKMKQLKCLDVFETRTTDKDLLKLRLTYKYAYISVGPAISLEAAKEYHRMHPDYTMQHEDGAGELRSSYADWD